MSSSSIRVRPATSDDVALLSSMIRGLAEYEELLDQVDNDDRRLGEHLFGPQPYAEALIAEHDGRAAGYALFFHTYSTFLARPGIFLEDLFVDASLRGRGIGAALLARVAEIAVQRECGRLEWAVLDWNEPAIGFYRSIGARPVDGWSSYRLADDALHRFAARGRELRG